MSSQKPPDAVVIGGVGFVPGNIDLTRVSVATPYGNVTAGKGSIVHYGKTLELVFIQRHSDSGKTEHLPPHRLNYRANVWAAKELGGLRLIATNSVGSMGDYPPGTFLVPNDFIDMTRSRPGTFFDHETVHADMTEPYCHEIRKSLRNALVKNNFEAIEGVYVCTEGPRFETAAEIRMLAPFGDVVGMTGVPEVVLAKELGLCYASLCIITNRACGLSGKKLTADEVVQMLDLKQGSLWAILLDAVASLPPQRKCNCQDAISGARVG